MYDLNSAVLNGIYTTGISLAFKKADLTPADKSGNTDQFRDQTENWTSQSDKAHQNT